MRNQLTPGGLAHPGGDLNPRHRHVAMMVAQGRTNREIEELTGYDYNYIAILKGKPEFKLFVESMLREVQTYGMDQMLDQLKREFEPSVAKLKFWRDQDDEPAVSLGATKDILDRILPKKTITEEHKTVLHLDGAAVQALAGVVNEYHNGNGAPKDTVDVTPLTVVAKTIDELIAEDEDA